MRVRFFGVRGLTPVPGENTVVYGGNTSCVAAFTGDGEFDQVFVFDAGTGLRELGEFIEHNTTINRIHLFISHQHRDHIEGLGFFIPLFIPGYDVHVYGPGVNDLFSNHLLSNIFPLPLEKTECNLSVHDISANEGQIDIPQYTGSIEEEIFSVKFMQLNHMVDCYGYRLEWQKKALVYASDHEPYESATNDEDSDMIKNLAKAKEKKYRDFISKAKLLIADGQYLLSEYRNLKGWGHAHPGYLINHAHMAGVRTLAITHHDPYREDSQAAQIEKHFLKVLRRKKINMKLFLAKEGTEVQL